MPTHMAMTAGSRKLRFRLFVDAFRHASKGPTPVRNMRKIAIGTFTLLNHGALTVIFSWVIQSDSDGSIVPQSTAKHAASRIRLLNMKLLSRETNDSIWFSLFKYSKR